MTKKPSKVTMRGKTGRHVSRGTEMKTGSQVKRNAPSGEFISVKGRNTPISSALTVKRHDSPSVRAVAAKTTKGSGSRDQQTSGATTREIETHGLEPFPSVRVVSRPGSAEPEFVMVPFKIWTALRERVEDSDDIAAAKRVKAGIEVGGDELVPIDIADRLIDGEPPIKVWRTFRGKTQAQLATEAGLDQGYISELESGRKANPTANVLRALADALEVTIDDLLA